MLLQVRVFNVLGKYVEEQNNVNSSKSFQCTGKCVEEKNNATSSKSFQCTGKMCIGTKQCYLK